MDTPALGYFFVDAQGQQQGPLHLQALRNRHLSPDTLIWHRQLPEWVAANTLPELKDLFDVPPPIATATVRPQAASTRAHIDVRTLYAQTPWYRREGWVTLMVALTLFVGPLFSLPTLLILATGPVYRRRLDAESQLQQWTGRIKVVVTLFSLILTLLVVVRLLGS